MGNAGRDYLEDACARGSGIARNCPELPGIANANAAELLFVVVSIGVLTVLCDGACGGFMHHLAPRPS